jgi:DNA-binding SARP family transcriptional activator
VRFETEVQEEKRLSLRLLGPPEARLEGLPVRFRIKKELALLCYLATQGGRHPRRETSLGGRSAAAGGRRELIGRLQGDLGLYRGEFMEGFSLENAHEFELWLEGERARWRQVFGELCERLSRLEGEEGLIAEAIGTARLWVRQAPLEETAHRRLMELLSGAGESERALLVYEGFRNTLSRALGMEPSTQMQQLAARLQKEVEERASLGASQLLHAREDKAGGLHRDGACATEAVAPQGF